MNTRSLLPVLLIIGTTAHAQAMDRAMAGSLLARAQDAYAKAEYAEALALYDSVATTWDAAALRFNIGNCHFKLGDVPRAILHYERALRLAPGADDVRANLDLARQQVVDRVNELPGFSLGATWGRWRGGRDPDSWARRALWCCLVLFALLATAVALPRGVWKRAVQVCAGVMLIATITTTSLSIARAAEIRDRSEAIILAPKVDIRGEPREGATLLFTLHKGTKVSVLQQSGGWSEVRLPNGHMGWMPPGAAERI